MNPDNHEPVNTAPQHEQISQTREITQTSEVSQPGEVSA